MLAGLVFGLQSFLFFEGQSVKHVTAFSDPLKSVLKEVIDLYGTGQ